MTTIDVNHMCSPLQGRSLSDAVCFRAALSSISQPVFPTVSLRCESYLMEVFSQDEFLEVSRRGRRGPDSLPHFVVAVSKVVGSHSWHESVVPEREGLQR